MLSVPFAQTPPPGSLPPAWMNFVPMAVLFGLFYFLLIRPQQKTRREQEAMLKALKKHDEVVTSGGLHGTILNVKDDIVTLRIDDAAKVDIDRSAIARVKHAVK